jgi:hypothetical protein
MKNEKLITAEKERLADKNQARIGLFFEISGFYNIFVGCFVWGKGILITRASSQTLKSEHR